MIMIMIRRTTNDPPSNDNDEHSAICFGRVNECSMECGRCAHWFVGFLCRIPMTLSLGTFSVTLTAECWDINCLLLCSPKFLVFLNWRIRMFAIRLHSVRFVYAKLIITGQFLFALLLQTNVDTNRNDK